MFLNYHSTKIRTLSNNNYSNTLLLVLLTILLFVTWTNAQDYYPLEIGNRWDYEHSHADLGGPLFTDTFSTKIIDKVMRPNGKEYFVLNYGDISWNNYVRADSEYIYYYRESDSSDVPFFKLTSFVGETIYIDGGLGDTWYVTLEDTFFLNKLGFSTKIMVFELDGLFLRYVWLSEKFGPIFHYNTGEPPGYSYETYDIIGCIISDTAYGTILNIEKENTKITGFELLQNYPNPFNNSTVFQVTIPQNGNLKLQIFDINGKSVFEKNMGKVTPAVHKISWKGLSNSGTDVASGIYFYLFEFTGNDGVKNKQTRKMMLLR